MWATSGPVNLATFFCCDPPERRFAHGLNSGLAVLLRHTLCNKNASNLPGWAAQPRASHMWAHANISVASAADWSRDVGRLFFSLSLKNGMHVHALSMWATTEGILDWGAARAAAGRPMPTATKSAARMGPAMRCRAVVKAFR